MDSYAFDMFSPTPIHSFDSASMLTTGGFDFHFPHSAGNIPAPSGSNNLGVPLIAPTPPPASPSSSLTFKAKELKRIAQHEGAHPLKQAIIEHALALLYTGESLFSRKPRQRSPTAKIPRPANAFMIFKSAVNLAIQVPGNKGKGETICTLSGKLWRSLSEAQKRPWYERAKEVKREHKRLYPDYRYSPNRAARVDDDDDDDDEEGFSQRAKKTSARARSIGSPRDAALAGSPSDSMFSSTSPSRGSLCSTPAGSTHASSPAFPSDAWIPPLPPSTFSSAAPLNPLDVVSGDATSNLSLQQSYDNPSKTSVQNCPDFLTFLSSVDSDGNALESLDINQNFLEDDFLQTLEKAQVDTGAGDHSAASTTQSQNMLHTLPECLSMMLGGSITLHDDLQLPSYTWSLDASFDHSFNDDWAAFLSASAADQCGVWTEGDASGGLYNA